MKTTRTFGVLAALFAAACDGNETNVNAVYPDLTVTPTAVDFGGVAALYSSSAQIQLINSGLAVLDISEIRAISESGEVFTVDTEGPLSLGKDEQATLTVRFQPETYLTYAGSLTLSSNDEENPELVIPLAGEGIYAPTPDIDVSPPSYDFGTVVAGETEFATINIANEGDASLTLGDLVQVGSAKFSLISTDPSGYSIPGNQAVTLVYAYSPSDALGDNATVTIPSDDPDEPVVELPLLGNGGGDFDYPVAVIDCPPTIVPREIVYLDGSASNSSSGTLDFTWSIDEIPEGSAVDEIKDNTEAVANFTPDIAGDYEIRLVVTNSAGISSSPAICRMNAVPTEEFHIELSWDGTSADLDLHVMNSLGEFFLQPDDCNFCNQSPNWGDVTSLADDPSLDIDDQYGLGPENTNIDAPYDDVYTLAVHYFVQNSDEAVVATIRVYSYGVKVAEISHTIEYDYVWIPGVVNWPDGTFGVLDDYYDNLDYDEFGNPMDVDPVDGFNDNGPRTCF